MSQVSIASPLGEEKAALLQRLVDGLDVGALHWLSGYTAGLAARLPTAVPEAPATPTPVTIVYGTQTGNSRALAERLRQRLEAAGLAVRSLRADAYPTRELKNEKVLYVVISTQGDGDPPDDARGLYDFLRSPRAPALKQLRFSVLALGDSSYPKFCEVGRVIDERLVELGATRLVNRAECDVDFESTAEGWLGEALERAPRDATSRPALATVTPLRPVAIEPAATREKPFLSPVLANQKITGRGAGKDVRHLELSLEGSGLRYEPGDSVGVWPRNPLELVDEVLTALRLDGATDVTLDGKTLSLARWLSEERELTRLTRPFLEAHGARAGAGDLKHLLADNQLIDVLRAHPAEWGADELVGALRPLTPRLYSIASSQRQHPDEVHLTVSVVDYEAFGTRHFGAASRFLSTRASGEPVRIFIEPNERFRLPRDPSRDVVMIGPGTGVAPFRAFLQERAETGATGRNWLFFGEQNFRTTFLYQVEWQEALKGGTLQRLDLAFSRDQPEKIYVQHRLRERGRELYAWLEGGASLYVCGDAKRMAPDVHQALTEIAITHGGKSREDAEAWLDGLRDERRYLRDVY